MYFWPASYQPDPCHFGVTLSFAIWLFYLVKSIQPLTNALISLTESIKLSVDSGKCGCGTCLDLQKLLTLWIVIFYFEN